MSPAWKIAVRELRGGLRGFRIFLACLALGVAAIAGVGTVRSAIDGGLTREGAAILGGDAEATFTYRFASADERAWMERVALDVSEVVDFRSMLTVERDETERGLTQVLAVDDAYPLIGQVTLDPPGDLDAALSGRGGRPGIVMERILADRLALVPGDVVGLGRAEFVYTAALEAYPDRSAGTFGLGPRSIVRTQALQDSGLIADGTLFDTKYRLDLPEGTDLAAVADEASSRFRDSGLRWQDARNGAAGLSEFVDRLGAFLILVGLAGLAVGGIGVSAAVRSYLAGKIETIAVLKTFGAPRSTIFAAYGIQIGVLAGLGILAGLALGAGVPLAFAPLIEARLPVPAAFTIYPRPLLEAALYGVLAAAIFTLWPLARTQEVRAAALFRDALSAGRRLPPLWVVVTTAALLSLLVGLAAWFAEAWALTLWAAAGIVGALLLLAIAAAAIAPPPGPCRAS